MRLLYFTGSFPANGCRTAAVYCTPFRLCYSVTSADLSEDLAGFSNSCNQSALQNQAAPIRSVLLSPTPGSPYSCLRTSPPSPRIRDVAAFRKEGGREGGREGRRQCGLEFSVHLHNFFVHHGVSSCSETRDAFRSVHDLAPEIAYWTYLLTLGRRYLPRAIFFRTLPVAPPPFPPTLRAHLLLPAVGIVPMIFSHRTHSRARFAPLSTKDPIYTDGGPEAAAAAARGTYPGAVGHRNIVLPVRAVPQGEASPQRRLFLSTSHHLESTGNITSEYR